MNNVALLCGGFSRESVISYRSAALVEKSLSDVNVYKIHIVEEGWYYEHNGVKIAVDKNDFSLTIDGQKITFDYVYNFIHGSPGEDGLLSGYFEMLGISQSGSSTFASSLTFNKGMCNAFLRSHGIRVSNSIILYKDEDWNAQLDQISYPCFVKPNNGGSSIGNSRVNKPEDLHPALSLAFEHDDEIIVEDFVGGREFTCGVVEYQGKIEALAVSEVIVNAEFFDFDQKYSENGAIEVTPAEIDDELRDEIMRLTERVFRLLKLKNMGRVDFIHNGKELVLIEVNTIPGFSDKSFLPQMLAYRKIPVGDLLKEFRKADI